MTVILLSASAFSQPRFKGYIENRLYMTMLNNDFIPSNYKDNIRWGNYNRARVEMSADVSDNSYINLTVDYFNYSGYLLQLLRQPGSGDDPVTASNDERISVDRAYLKLYFSRADLTVGKQRISWGQSMLWSPFDVFNRVNFLDPQEEKPGVNAFRINVPLGVTSGFEAVFSPAATTRESRAGMRFIWNMFGTEFIGTTVHNVVGDLKQNITGFSFKTDMTLGLWFEGAYFDESPLPGNFFAENSYFKWLTGADYSFLVSGRTMYLQAEFTRDESGVTSKAEYNYLEALNRGRSLLARDYIYGSARYTYSDYTSFSSSVLCNLNDGGITFMPSVSHSIFPNSDITFGMYMALAEDGTEFNPMPVNDPFNYAGNSIIYCWFKLYM